MRRRLNRSHQGASTNREQQVKRVAAVNSVERGAYSSALCGVSICLMVASCVVVPFTIRRWNVGPMMRASPPFIRHNVDLLDAKDGSNELNTTVITGPKASRAKARKPKQVGVKKLTTAQRLQELERENAGLRNMLREKEGGIEAIPSDPVFDNDLNTAKAVAFLRNRVVEEERQKALEYLRVRKRAQDFLDVLMNDDAYLPVNASIGMTYLPDLPDLEVQKGFEIDQKFPMIIRNITDAFWDACIEVGDVPGVSFRVAVIGTPGIGKTTSTPLLIRKLLKKGKTVVYHVRTENRNKWIYEFVPEGDSYRADVYTDRSDLESVPSLRLRSTYYIVDPGKTKDSCDPDASFEPSVIIVASPDDRHWGGSSSFIKSLRAVKGLFKFYPLWSEEEIRAVKYILGPNMSDSTLNERLCQFGGVPRNVFEESRLIPLLEQQKTAVRALTAAQAQSIAEGYVDFLSTFKEDQPKSAVAAFDLAPDDNGTFTKPRAVLVSPYIKDQVYARHAGTLWRFMWSQADAAARGYFLQSYVRTLLTEFEHLTLDVRQCVGRRDKRYNETFRFTLPRCNEVRMVVNPARAVADPTSKPFVLYHSSIGNYELIDCVYKDDEDKVYAIQTTLQKEGHPAKPAQMKDLQETLRNFKNITLLYMVPDEIFPRFVTDPVYPKNDTNVTLNVYHASISRPSMELVAGNK
jgi:hypothetical protein